MVLLLCVECSVQLFFYSTLLVWFECPYHSICQGKVLCNFVELSTLPVTRSECTHKVLRYVLLSIRLHM